MNDMANGLGALNFNNVELIKGRWKNNSVCESEQNQAPLQLNSILSNLPSSKETQSDDDSDMSSSFDNSSVAPFSPIISEEDAQMNLENPKA